MRSVLKLRTDISILFEKFSKTFVLLTFFPFKAQLLLTFLFFRLFSSRQCFFCRFQFFKNIIIKCIGKYRSFIVSLFLAVVTACLRFLAIYFTCFRSWTFNDCCDTLSPTNTQCCKSGFHITTFHFVKKCD